MDLIANPSLIKKENLEKLHSIYRGPMRRSLIAMSREMLSSKTFATLSSLPSILIQLEAIVAFMQPLFAYASSGLKRIYIEKSELKNVLAAKWQMLQTTHQKNQFAASHWRGP